VRQLGSVHLLGRLGTVVLSDLSQLNSDPHHDPRVAYVFHRHSGKCHHRSRHRAHRRLFFSWYDFVLLFPIDLGTLDRFLPCFFFAAVGTFLTGCASLFFAVIDPNAPYWAFGFPSACLIALGVDFAYASGTLFIAKISMPHEQSVAGALFQAMTQIGSAIGLSVSTIVFNSVLRVQSRRLGISVDQEGDNAPMAAQLKAYRAAMWTGFSFGVLCTCSEAFRYHLGLWYGLSSLFFRYNIVCIFAWRGHRWASTRKRRNIKGLRLVLMKAATP
jgi:hypothetical protein